jgi:hypothetical protein
VVPLSTSLGSLRVSARAVFVLMLAWPLPACARPPRTLTTRELLLVGIFAIFFVSTFVSCSAPYARDWSSLTAFQPTRQLAPTLLPHRMPARVCRGGRRAPARLGRGIARVRCTTADVCQSPNAFYAYTHTHMHTFTFICARTLTRTRARLRAPVRALASSLFPLFAATFTFTRLESPPPPSGTPAPAPTLIRGSAPLQQISARLVFVVFFHRGTSAVGVCYSFSSTAVILHST